MEIPFQKMFLSINLMILCLSWLILSKKHLIGKLKLQQWKCCMSWSFLWLWEQLQQTDDLLACITWYHYKPWFRTALEQQAVKYLSEFLQWSIKQSGSNIRTHNTKSIMKSVYHLWSEAFRFIWKKRSLCCFFRIHCEEESLVSESYWRLSSLPWPVSNYCILTLSILEHLSVQNEQQITWKRSLWITHLSFKSTRPKDGFLKSWQVDWISETFASVVILYGILATNRIGSFLWAQSNSQDWLHEGCESSSTTNLSQISQWCQGLQAQLECYSWIVGERLSSLQQFSKKWLKVVIYINDFLSNVPDT